MNAVELLERLYFSPTSRASNFTVLPDDFLIENSFGTRDSGDLFWNLDGVRFARRTASLTGGLS